MVSYHLDSRTKIKINESVLSVSGFRARNIRSSSSKNAICHSRISCVVNFLGGKAMPKIEFSILRIVESGIRMIDYNKVNNDVRVINGKERKYESDMVEYLSNSISHVYESFIVVDAVRKKKDPKGVRGELDGVWIKEV